MGRKLSSCSNRTISSSERPVVQNTIGIFFSTEKAKRSESFDGEEVLKGIDFSMEKGEVVSIIGSSGSGKTTLLSVISGLNKAYRGKILINGKALSKIKNIAWH